MRLSMRLREVLEELFVSGAGEEHDDAEMLSLLDYVDFENLARVFRFFEDPIYEYWAGGLGMYFGRRLTDYKRNAFNIESYLKHHLKLQQNDVFLMESVDLSSEADE